MWSDSVQRLDYVEAPPGVSSKLQDAFSCGTATILLTSVEDRFLACENCFRVRVLSVCVVQLRYRILSIRILWEQRT